MKTGYWNVFRNQRNSFTIITIMCRNLHFVADNCAAPCTDGMCLVCMSMSVCVCVCGCAFP